MAEPKIKEKALYQQLRQKDKEAFIKAYDLYLNNIYRFIYFKVDNREEAEDLTSQTFLKTWDFIQSNKLDEFKNLKSFIYTVARNCVIDHYRKKNLQQNVALNIEIKQHDVVDEKQDLSRQVDLNANFQVLEKVMFELKDEYREVIILRFINEMSIAEISGVIGKGSGNVRVLIFRALNALRDLANNANIKK